MSGRRGIFSFLGTEVVRTQVHLELKPSHLCRVSSELGNNMIHAVLVNGIAILFIREFPTNEGTRKFCPKLVKLTRTVP